MKLLYLAAMLASLPGFVSAQPIHVSGEIEGLSDSAGLSITLLPLVLYAHVPWSNTVCVDGTFETSCKTDTLMWHLVRIDSEEFYKGNIQSCVERVSLDIYFFAYPGDSIIISANKESIGVSFCASGNKIANQQREFLKSTYTLDHQLLELLQKRTMPNYTGELDQRISEMKKEIERIRLRMIIEHPDWEYSAIALPSFEISVVKDVYETLTPSVKESFFGRYISDLINQ